MDVQFHPINPKASLYPAPHLPVLPLFTLNTLTFCKNSPPVSAFLEKGEFFTHARVALAQALKRSGVDERQAVLIPAYHCGSMVEPALWLKSDVLLYQLNDDLSPNIDNIKALIKQSEKPVKAMLLTHYFGFPQESQAWLKFCDSQEITLIEDCAHSFFGKDKNNVTLGTTGHYAIASVKKFFCSPDGGILIEKTAQATSTPLERPTIKKEILALYRVVTLSAYSQKLGWIGALIKQFDQWRTKPQETHNSTPKTAPSQAKWQWFHPHLINTQGLRTSKWLLKNSHSAQIVRQRRYNYQQLLKGIKAVPNVQPLYPTLPEQVVPYMLPIILSSGEAVFNQLKEAGLPVWRWEELAESDCKISQQYRLNLLQLPCHQTVTELDLEWMISTLKRITGCSHNE